MEIKNEYGTITKEERLAIKLDCLNKDTVANYRNKPLSFTGRGVAYTSVSSDGSNYNAMLVEVVTETGSKGFIDVSGEVVMEQIRTLFEECDKDGISISDLTVRFTTKESKTHTGQSYNILTIGG